MPNEEGQINVKGPLGTSATFKGMASWWLLVMVVFACVAVASNRISEARADERHFAERALLQQIVNGQADERETTRALIYMLGLPAEQREKLLQQMQKPKMIRDMQRAADDGR